MEGTALARVIRKVFSEEVRARKALENEKNFLGEELGEIALMCKVVKFQYSFNGEVQMSSIYHFSGFFEIF